MGVMSLIVKVHLGDIIQLTCYIMPPNVGILILHCVHVGAQLPVKYNRM